MNLLSRDEFRNLCLKRDKNCCVVCGVTNDLAVHHIIERRLFDDGGYYLENGATLCPPCHIKAEQTLISPQRLRDLIGIKKIVLPEHLYPDYEYTKWTDIENANTTRVPGELFYDESVQKILESGRVLHLYQKHIKYPRTFHLPWSPGRTEDDKVLKDCSCFEGKEVVVTVKLDGENSTIYSDGYYHARSLDSDNHPSRNWAKNYLAARCFDLPEGWRLCGENLYAKHSIHYTGLESYFYLFSIWNEKNVCLSWEETVEWANLLDIPVVPVLYDGVYNEELIKNLYKERFGNDECEGYVLRLKSSFPYSSFRKSVAKYVRACHVQTNQHWVKGPIVKNTLKK